MTGLQRELAAVTPARHGARAAIAAAAILALSALVYSYIHRAPKLTAKDTIILAEFENQTNDPVFDQTLRQGLSVQLQQSPFLALASDERINESLRLMNRPLGTRLTPEVSREICVRTGSSAVLEGSIVGLGRQYVLWLRARNCRTGEVLAEEQAQTEGREEVLKALSQIAIQMRTRLGESLASVQEHSKPLEQATTSSLEALQAYSAAKIAMYASGPAAIPHLQQAIAIDPQFAMAHADLGFRLWDMGQTGLGAEQVYAYTATGVIVTPAALAGPFAEVGTQTFDGQGHTTATATASQNGNIVQLTITGTYTVSPDCTGTLTLQVAPIGITVPVFIVIDSSWNEFQAIETSPGVVITRIGHKLYPGRNI